MPFIIDLIPAQPNLNGNTQESLIAQLSSLMESLRDVRDKLSGCSDHWHGRNFLPQGDREAQLMRRLAEDAWRMRIAMIDEMHEELTTLGLEIQGGSPQPKLEVTEILVDGWDSVEGGASINGHDKEEEDDGRDT